ncbi:MAG: hypothetical protein KKC18_06490 [Chloroflexi bacterium]|nr:hypothetical protein [Chloroflexota bacterium]
MGAWERGSVGAGEEVANISLANLPLANLPPANPHTSNARTVSYTYDRSGRLTSANYGQGKLLVYHYDLPATCNRSPATWISMCQ